MNVAETIKEKIDIVEFLKGYLSVQPAGRNFKALCPFHREKTPSFMISPERQSWHCFGCGLGGDAFAFLMRYENIEFWEALKILAEKAGVDLGKYSPAENRYFQVLYDLNEKAKDFFKEQLNLPVNSEAKEYLLSRGLLPETISEFEIGFAPSGPEALTLRLLNLGYEVDDLIRAGLSFRTEKKQVLDRFRNRLMFPLYNSFGKAIGFTGRILPAFDDGRMGKYINSPETPVFVKSKFLYGFNKSKNFIRESGAFIVEGQMDFLLSWQVGIKNVVATSGTALTPNHLLALRRLTNKVIFSFDNDEAGKVAAERAIDLASHNDFEVKVIALPSNFKDPAEAAQNDAELFKKAVLEARPAIEFYFDRYLENQEISSLKKGIRIILGKIRNLTSPAEQNYWLKKLAQKTKIDEKALAEELEKAPAEKDVRELEEEENENQEVQLSRSDLISERLFVLAKSKSNLELLEKIFDYLPLRYQKIFEILKKGESKASEPELDVLIEKILFLSGNPEEKEGEFEKLKSQLVKEYFKEQKNSLLSLLKEAEAEGESLKIEDITKKFDVLVKKELEFNYSNSASNDEKKKNFS